LVPLGVASAVPAHPSGKAGAVTPSVPAGANRAAASKPSASATDRASVQAVAAGDAVPVASATTPTSTLTAQPDGSFTKTVSPLPVRVKQPDGSWSPVDATLTHNADGSWSPATTPSALTLSGGGSGALAVLDDAGRKVSLSWPTDLPAPTVSGATAT
jgi:hypothetical protein